jgi:glucan phosphoethanolaminetransferase (alkaline phosphatase superfamily)
MLEKEYQISEEVKNKLRIQQLRKVIFSTIACFIVGTIISFIQLGDLNIFLKIITPLMILVFVAAAIGIFFGLIIFNKSYLDIIMKTDDETISITRNGKEVVKLEKNDIIKIEETSDGTLIIYSNKHPKRIFIKNHFQDFNELYNDLTGFKQIEKTNKKTNRKITYILSFIYLIIYGIFLTSSTREIIIIFGIIFVIVMSISLVIILFNKFVDKRIKIISLIIIYVIYEAVKKIIEIL